MKGLIYDIQRFAIHDGPGIRTLVYMKGCPLKCLWCSTPQTQKSSPEILYIEPNCKKCLHCVDECPKKAIKFTDKEKIKIDRKLCNTCGQCVDTCPNQALKLVGDQRTVEELYKDVMKDNPFYRRSNGGVTIGGGEPTMQHEFVRALLQKCKETYMHTAMETCGYVKWESLEKILDLVDLLYFDIKHMNLNAHKKLTGVSNELILENARKASKMRTIIIRIPLIPGYNDSEENILKTAKFAAELGENLLRIELLPYHKFGTRTYEQLGREYELKDLEPPNEEYMIKLKKLIESCGVKAQIGG
ncbi:MAG: glycyl-radical enzyme activating protein [Candidatus Heimdallarchaeota archaeon]|nr:glycyl-radical enzyme activating protein [Candidatus Heimdallarchaeota archaeon]